MTIIIATETTIATIMVPVHSTIIQVHPGHQVAEVQAVHPVPVAAHL
jgi:hypothetical protein